MKKTITMESKLNYLLPEIKNNDFIFAASGYLASEDVCKDIGKKSIQELCTDAILPNGVNCEKYTDDSAFKIVENGEDKFLTLFNVFQTETFELDIEKIAEETTEKTTEEGLKKIIDKIPKQKCYTNYAVKIGDETDENGMAKIYFLHFEETMPKDFNDTRKPNLRKFEVLETDDKFVRVA